MGAKGGVQETPTRRERVISLVMQAIISVQRTVCAVQREHGARNKRVWRIHARELHPSMERLAIVLASHRGAVVTMHVTVATLVQVERWCVLEAVGVHYKHVNRVIVHRQLHQPMDSLEHVEMLTQEPLAQLHAMRVSA